jgi:hypothetical protein
MQIDNDKAVNTICQLGSKNDSTRYLTDFKQVLKESSYEGVRNWYTYVRY